MKSTRTTRLSAAVAAALSLTFGATAQSLDLTGSPDHAVVPHDAALAPASFTVEAWCVLDPSVSVTYPTIIRKNPTSAEAYTLRLSNFGLGSGFYIPELNVTTSSGTFITRAFSAPIPLGVPTHIAATFAPGSVRIYVDGVLVRDNPFVPGTLAAGSGEVWIGRGDPVNPLGEQFVGTLDAVRIWDVARNQTEIAQTMAVELEQADGLTAAWNFDCDLTDSRNGFDATAASGVAAFAPEFANFAGALELAGTDPFVTVPHAPALAPSTVTVEAWCELDPATTDTYPTIVRKNVNTSEAYTLRLSNFGLSAGVYIAEFNLTTGSSTFILRGLSAPIPLGQATHVAGTFDGSQMRLYVDGVAVASRSAAGTIADTGGDLLIGRGDSNNPLGEQFAGKLDTIRIWDHARTACAIEGGMDRELTSGAGLVAAWNFDHGLHDVSGNGHDGAASADVGFGAELTDQARSLKLQATAPGHIEVPHAAALAPATVTVEALFRLDPNVTDTYPTLVRKNPTTAEAYVLRLSSFQAGGNYIPEFNIRTNSGIRILRASGAPITLGAVHHLAGTFDGSVARIYLDGVLVQSSFSSAGTLADTGGVLSIGRGDPGNPLGEQFSGVLDTVRVWRFARSGADIASTMRRDIAAAPGLVASYSFDGDAADGSGNGFDGATIGTLDHVDEIGDQVGAPCMPIAYGAGSTACGSAPTMFGSTPIELGGVQSFGCIGAPANAAGALWLSGSGPVGPLTFAGIDLWVNLASPLFVSLPATSDATGRSNLTLPIDSTSILRVVPLTFQYLFIDFSCTTPLAIVTSDGLLAEQL